MKTLSYFVLMMVAVLLLGARCDREDKPDVPPVTPPVEEPQEPEPVKKTPDDFEGAGVRDYYADLNTKFAGDDTIFFTYYTFCNDSDHTLTFYVSLKQSHGEVILMVLEPGQKDILHAITEYYPPFEYYDKLLSVKDLAYIEIYYSTEDEDDVYEYIHDFDQQSQTACIGDESQWEHEQYNDRNVSWVYYFTNADYERAKQNAAKSE